MIHIIQFTTWFVLFFFGGDISHIFPWMNHSAIRSVGSEISGFLCWTRILRMAPVAVLSHGGDWAGYRAWVGPVAMCRALMRHWILNYSELFHCRCSSFRGKGSGILLFQGFWKWTSKHVSICEESKNGEDMFDWLMVEDACLKIWISKCRK